MIEDDLHCLAAIAHRIYSARRRREAHLPNEILGEPGWDMLLDLFIQHAAKKRITVTSCCVAAAVPPTTALRWIDNLEKAGLVRRTPCESDGRRSYIEISEAGVVAVGKCLAEWSH